MPLEEHNDCATVRAILLGTRVSVPLIGSLSTGTNATLMAACCRLLVGWQFSGPEDDRIEPFVQALVRAEGSELGPDPLEVGIWLRELLAGKSYGAKLVPAEQLPLFEGLTSRAIIQSNGITPDQVEILLGRAEGEIHRLHTGGMQGVAGVTDLPQPTTGGRFVRWAALAGTAVILAVLVTGLLVPGWMRGSSEVSAHTPHAGSKTAVGTPPSSVHDRRSRSTPSAGSPSSSAAPTPSTTSAHSAGAATDSYDRFVARFVSQVGGLHESSAVAMLCQQDVDPTSRQQIRVAITRHLAPEVDPRASSGGIAVPSGPRVYPLIASSGGYGMATVRTENKHPCVAKFFLNAH